MFRAALRAEVHQGDEQRAEQDPARDRGLLDEAGLPHDRGKVEGRHERGEPHAAVQLRERQDGCNERDVREIPEPAVAGRDDHPVLDRGRDPTALDDGSAGPGGRHRSHDRLRDDAERDDPAKDGADPPPRAEPDDDEQQEDGVEEQPGPVLRVLGREELEGDVDHDRTEDHAGQAADAAENHDRVDGDQERQREVSRTDRREDGREDASREACDPGAEAERHQLEAVDRHAHRLRREWILTEGAPGAAGAGFADEVQADEHERDDTEQEVELLRPARELVAEERQRVDVGDAVRPAGEPLAADGGVRGEDEDDERLPEEERHDREVVAEQPAGRDSEQEAENRRRDDDDRNRHERRPVDVVLRRGHQSVEVGAEPEERHVTEVQQAGVADHDVQAQAEQDVEQREDSVGEEVAAAHPERQGGGDADEHGELERARYERGPAAEVSRDALAGLDALLDLGDPVVDADARTIRAVATRAHQTLVIAREPRSPVGRTRRTTMRIAKTVRSDQRPPR